MSKIKYNGYYYYLDLKKNINDTYNYVMRFFPNNKVITVTHCSHDISKFWRFFPNINWFNENYEDNGTFNIKEDRISFECGKVEYKGTIINDDKLVLFCHSNLNGYESIEEYKFISFDVLSDVLMFENEE